MEIRIEYEGGLREARAERRDRDVESYDAIEPVEGEERIAKIKGVRRFAETISGSMKFHTKDDVLNLTNVTIVGGAEPWVPLSDDFDVKDAGRYLNLYRDGELIVSIDSTQEEVCVYNGEDDPVAVLNV